MASIMPFKGLHYNYFFKDISNLICPPYYIIKKNDVSKFLSKSPYNAIRLELPESPLNNEKSIKLIYLAVYRTKQYDKPFDLQYYFLPLTLKSCRFQRA